MKVYVVTKSMIERFQLLDKELVAAFIDKNEAETYAAIRNMNRAFREEFEVESCPLIALGESSVEEDKNEQ